MPAALAASAWFGNYQTAKVIRSKRTELPREPLDGSHSE